MLIELVGVALAAADQLLDLRGIVLRRGAGHIRVIVAEQIDRGLGGGTVKAKGEQRCPENDRSPRAHRSLPVHPKRRGEVSSLDLARS